VGCKASSKTTRYVTRVLRMPSACCR
jgi:hypothetical protein